MAENKIIPLETRKKIIRAHEEGQPLATIGKTYGYSISGVSRFLKHYRETGRIEPRERSKKFVVTQEKIETIQKLIDANPKLTLKEVKEQSGLDASINKISYIIKNYTPNARIAYMQLTSEVHKKILSDYDKGLRRDEIAINCNCSTSAVDKVLEFYRKRGDIDYTFKRVPQETKDRIAMERSRGLPLKEIASKYGLKIKTVDYILKPYFESGQIKKMNSRKMPLEIQERIAADYNRGLSRKEITANSGYCRDSVDKMLKHLNEVGKIKFKKPRKKIPPGIKKKVVKARKRGLTLQEIAENYGIALSTAHAVLRDNDK